MKKIDIYLSVVVLNILLVNGLWASSPPATLSLVKSVDTGDRKGTEIISINARQRIAAVSNSKQGVVDLYSLAEPENPIRLKRVELGLAKGEQITSVAIHPGYDYFVTVIQAASPTAAGRLEIRDTTSGNLRHQVDLGVGPDGVVIDPTGSYGLIANEAEEFVLNREAGTYSSAAGSLTLVKFAADPLRIMAEQISLDDLSGTPGMVSAADNRFIEREIDWNGDGEISEEPFDLNGNGQIDKAPVSVGKFRGVTIKAKEKNGELFLFPLIDNRPDLLEPEYVAFSLDGSTAWAVLQENNGVVEVDTASAKITRVFGLGTTTHYADINDNDHVSFSSTLTALREPDGMIVTLDDKYLVTADEGDTDPKASKTKSGPAAGGRTVSVFDVVTGQLVGDTGNQIDERVHAAGFYPESRSDNKGSEPEMVIALQINGINYLAVGLERANGVALVSLADPQQPAVVSVAPIADPEKTEKIGPEGIAYLFDEPSNRHYLYTANEKNGSISIFEVLIH